MSFSMFSAAKSRHAADSFSKHRAGKATSSKSRRSFREHGSFRRPAQLDLSSAKQHPLPTNAPTQSQLNSATITLLVGHNPSRLFAAHTDVLTMSPFFKDALRSQFYDSSTRQLVLEDEVPEVFASVLEYLYKHDYFPKLEYDCRRQTWSLETALGSPANAEPTVWIPGTSRSTAAAMSPTSLQPHPTNPAAGQGVYVLKDTAVYCAAERYGLPQLKRVALRKQGLQSSIPVATILASARYAYANTPENDRHLRAHYLALIIRSRSTFKRSGTMQVEMGAASPRLGSDTSGGTGLWFDLFVAMCNHLDDLERMHKSPMS